MPVRRLFPLLAFALLLALPMSAHAGGVTWSRWDAGLKEAAGSNRYVLVDVYTDWCGWCRRMEADVYAKPEVREYLSRRFVTVKLDAESDASATYRTRKFSESSLASRFGVTGYPTTIFLKPNGDHLVNVPGYVPADRFMQLLRYVGDGHLERGVPFDEFVRKSGEGTPQR